MTKKPIKRIQKVEGEERRSRIAEMYLGGKTQYEIGVVLGIAQPSVHQHLKIIRQEWVTRAVQDFSARKAEELARLDMVETQAWGAWYRSCETYRLVNRRMEQVPEAPRRKKGEEAGTGVAPMKMVKVKAVVETRQVRGTGEAAFLTVVMTCINTRLKLLGLLADAGPTNVNQIVMKWDELYGAREAANPVQARLDEERKQSPRLVDAVPAEKSKKKP